MKTEKATYSYAKIAECEKIVKSIRKTASKKCAHFGVAIQIQNAFEKCFDLTKCYIFFPYDNLCNEYLNAAYDFKKHTQKELNNMKNYTLLYLKNELQSIKSMMDSGEVNAID